MKKIMLWFFLLALAAGLYAGFDGQLTLSEYTVTNARIPTSFDGYRIAVVSDLHAKSFGEAQQELLNMIHGTECDLVCFLGDMVSHDTADFQPVWDLIDGLEGLPMVYVAGNNELAMRAYDAFLSGLNSRGVIVLDDMTESTMILRRGEERIVLHGYPFTDSRSIANRLPMAERGCYNVLLYHDPHCFPETALLDYDLMLSGHVHGGVIRLPLLGSPLEMIGEEPYTKGVYESQAATLIVSGGLGNQDNIPRFFNDPEVVLITLKSAHL